MYKLKVTILTLAVLLLLIGCSASETPTEEAAAVPTTEVAAVVEPMRGQEALAEDFRISRPADRSPATGYRGLHW